MEGNMQEYLTEKEAREKRLAVYTEKIQETVLNKSAETIRLLVEERHNQKMTQQELSDITGIQPSNLARFESGGRIPTLIVLEKYANALGKHIEIKTLGSDRASSKGYIVRWVEAPSNKLLTTAFEASLESVTVTRRLSVDSKIAGIAMEHRNPKVSEGRHRGQGGRQYMHLSLW